MPEAMPQELVGYCERQVCSQSHEIFLLACSYFLRYTNLALQAGIERMLKT
jgi:hypothetical protein